VREKERKRERERGLTELERREVHTKKPFYRFSGVMITWIPYTGYGTMEQREKPPRNESFTQRRARVADQKKNGRVNNGLNLKGEYRLV
jgi:hypothetical protein